MCKKLFILLLAGIYAFVARAEDFKKIVFEQLPFLETPRAIGQPVLLGDEVTLFGGHTTGYKLIETAEYYRGGAWHTVRMMYPHDGGAITRLPDGKLFLSGGNGESFGIGQSWGAEIYDPESHSFTPIGIMDRKRSLHSALALPDGSVIIAGNWHGPDGIEVYTPGSGFSTFATLDSGWCYPYIIRTGKDEFIVFSPMDSYGKPTGAFVHTQDGERVNVRLLEEWKPIFNYSTSDDDQRIADYTYLVLANRKDSSGAGLLKVSAGVFSLLELEREIPLEGPTGALVSWCGGPQIDRFGRTAWIQGYDVEGRVYFAKIGYNPMFDGGKASVRLYYAETPGGFPYGKALLLPGGKLMLSGGVAQVPGETVIVNDHFNALSEVFLFHTEEPEKAGIPIWAIIIGVLLICGVVVLLFLRKKKPTEVPADQAKKLNADLMEEMARLIGEKELFLRKDLRVADIAQELATNQTYVSMLVNNLSGDNFATMIGGYRVRYAQKLMREHPDMVHADVAERSGFASRTAFLRTFKAQTGLTPTEWKQQEGIQASAAGSREM
ncbi:MAG: helix-turn-helix domain-containing protein [Bacteroidales bacterium]|nr:helix-turn-helix domain-containing protein [Bacteroidales bacterium]